MIYTIFFWKGELGFRICAAQEQDLQTIAKRYKGGEVQQDIAHAFVCADEKTIGTNLRIILIPMDLPVSMRLLHRSAICFDITDNYAKVETPDPDYINVSYAMIELGSGYNCIALESLHTEIVKNLWKRRTRLLITIIAEIEKKYCTDNQEVRHTPWLEKVLREDKDRSYMKRIFDYMLKENRTRSMM